MAERLQKVLSQWGIASRRQAEAMIQQGRVKVNGQVAELGLKAEPDADVITVDGRAIRPEQRPDHCYLLLNKPLGMVSTCDDPEGRPTVLDALKADQPQAGLHPVGRLDVYSTGALLLTNDGEFTYRLTHPKHDVSKTYQVWVEGVPQERSLATWRAGIELEGRLTRPAKVEVLSHASTHKTLLKITLWEGRNRQIRRVAKALGHRVLSLHRTAIGPIRLGQLSAGEYRSLSSEEVRALLAESTASTDREAHSPTST
jgi:23S rRNA pseudouridine2605 synthase